MCLFLIFCSCMLCLVFFGSRQVITHSRKRREVTNQPKRRDQGEKFFKNNKQGLRSQSKKRSSETLTDIREWRAWVFVCRCKTEPWCCIDSIEDGIYSLRIRFHTSCYNTFVDITKGVRQYMEMVFIKSCFPGQGLQNLSLSLEG